ncbi:MAG: SBBP repeat-containing protein [Terriglobia bacterium]
MFRKVLDYAQSLLGTHLNPNGLSWCHGWLMASVPVTSLFLICGAAAASNRVAAQYGKIPLSFEANQGQTDSHVQFLSRGSGYSLFLTPDEVVLNLERQKPASSSQAPGSKPQAAPADTLRMKLVGANSGAAVAGVDPQPGVVSYLIGNDPKKWHSGIPTYSKVNYAQIYPGVDLVFYGNQRQLEYDFVIAPGADPSRIAWQIEGARARVDAEGNLVLSAPHGSASFQKPVLYQRDGDTKTSVEGSFAVAGNQIRFRLGSYDHSRALIIDPVLSYASYLSGSGNDHIGLATGPGDLAVGTSQALAVDSEGSAYVTGYTYSIDFPTKDPYQSAPPAKVSGVPPGVWPTAFVTKFSPDGNSLVYSTYLGGNGYDLAYAIAVDSHGDAYVTGQTDSPNFPTTSGAYQTICDEAPYSPPETPSSACGSSNVSAFVTELNSTGTGLVYSTFLGGYAYAYATAIAVDTAGRAYVAGNEDEYCSTDYVYQGCFPTTSGAVISGNETGGRSPQYAFVAAFDPTGAQLLYSTIFGDLNGVGPNAINGSGATWGTGVAVDANGYFYLIGDTTAGDLPTTAGVIQPTSGPLGTGGTYVEAWRGFIAKFNPVTSTGGASLAYATYLGGHTESTGDYISGITIDGESNAYIVGYTNSKDFPVTAGAYSTVCGPDGQNCAAAHVTKLNPSATAILWSTFVGDSKSDGSDAVYFTGPIQLDGNGNVYIMGQPNPGFPMVNPVEPTPTGGDGQVLVAELDPTGANLLFSTIIGSDGLDAETPAGLAVDPDGDMYLAGNTVGPDLITTPGAFQTTNTKGGCCWAGFVAKISPAEVSLSPTSLTFGPQEVGTTSAHQTVTLTINGEGTFRVSSITASGDFGETNTCGHSLAHSSCTITVTFRPTTTGPRSGLITIIDYASGGRQTVTLSGTGVRVVHWPGPIVHPPGPPSQPAPLKRGL